MKKYIRHALKQKGKELTKGLKGNSYLNKLEYIIMKLKIKLASYISLKIVLVLLNIFSC